MNGDGENEASPGILETGERWYSMSSDPHEKICPDCGAELRLRSRAYSTQLAWLCDTPECREREKQQVLAERKEEMHRTMKENPGEILRCLNVPKKYWNASFDSFSGGEKYVESLRRYMSGGVASVYLYGKCGSGKTHLAVATLREMHLAGDGFLPRCYFKSVPELLCDIRNSFREESEENEKRIIEKYSGYEVLVLDDLGAEKSSEFSIATLYLIVNSRLNHELATMTRPIFSMTTARRTSACRRARR
jgi:DNA replication protein DnaC